jgi:hypothetical protein
MTFKTELKLIANESKVFHNTDAFLPSVILPQICRHIRGHNSVGEKNFLKNWLEPAFKKLGLEFTNDAFGNYYVQIKGPQMERVLHVGHLDTVSSASNLKKYQKVIIDKDNFMTLDHAHYASLKGADASMGVLGADDGSAIAVMLYLMANGVSGCFLLTKAEEIGCLGANYIVKNHPEFLEKFDIALEVDRADTFELIAEQSTGKCASRGFTKTLADAIGMKHEHSDGGIITDLGNFNTLIKENVNLAAGYQHQHSSDEIQDMLYIEILAKQMAKLDYGSLVVSRKVTDLGDTGWGNYGGYGGGYSRSKSSSGLHKNSGYRYDDYEDYDYDGFFSSKQKSKTEDVKGICPALLQKDPALETGLSIDDLTYDEQTELYQNLSDSDWYFMLNADARRELMRFEYPIITGVTCDKLPYAELVDFIASDPEAFANYFIEQKLDLAVVGADDYLQDINDIYEGKL